MDTKREKIQKENATKPIQKPILFQDTIKIIRGKHTFELRISDIITKESPSFFCKKCHHKWLPTKRNFDKVPFQCPKCGDNYWFVSKKELKQIRLERSSMTHSINKPKARPPVTAKVITNDNKPKAIEKKTITKEDKKNFKW